MGLIGETGCGKTVLGMSIIRLLQPSTRIQGRIIYKGRDLLELKEEEMRLLRGKEIAMILQNPTTSLNPVLKVGDQIAEVLQLHMGLDKKQAKAKAVEMLAATMIPEASKRADQYPHELSGGMKERVMIAMGLASQPSFVIADEPTKGLDARTKSDIIRLIRDMTSGRSMLMITHDLAAAGEICDSIAVMYAGELLEEASAKTILSRALSSLHARLHPFSSCPGPAAHTRIQPFAHRSSPRMPVPSSLSEGYGYLQERASSDDKIGEWTFSEVFPMRLIEVLDLKKYYASGLINKEYTRACRWRFIPHRAGAKPWAWWERAAAERPLWAACFSG